MARKGLLGSALARAALAAATGLAALAGFAVPAAADAWRYTDERGGVHFTDQPSNVPERYQASLKRISMQSRPKGDGESGAPEAAREVEAPPVDHRAADPAERPRELSALEERLLAQASGDFDTEQMEEQIQGWVDTWGIAFMLSGIPWAVVIFGCWIHTLQRRRFVWMITNVMFWGVSIPLYILLRLDPLGVPARVGILVLWCAPLVVGGLGMFSLVEAMGGMGTA